MLINGKLVHKTWRFKSYSDPSKSYEAHLYEDGSYSCNCKGWAIQKRDALGPRPRACKHTYAILRNSIEPDHDYHLPELRERPKATDFFQPIPADAVVTQIHW